MIHPQDANLLESIIRRESRSLLQYANEAFPWARAGTNEVLGKLSQMAQEEMAAIGTLERILTKRRHISPRPGPYPMAFTTLNYIAVDHLVPLLIEHQTRGIAATEKARASLTDEEARAEVDRLLEIKRRHLDSLEAVASTPAKATS